MRASRGGWLADMRRASLGYRLSECQHCRGTGIRAVGLPCVACNDGFVRHAVSAAERIEAVRAMEDARELDRDRDTHEIETHDEHPERMGPRGA